jgi:hypothetical protein
MTVIVFPSVAIGLDHLVTLVLFTREIKLSEGISLWYDMREKPLWQVEHWYVSEETLRAMKSHCGPCMHGKLCFCDLARHHGNNNKSKNNKNKNKTTICRLITQTTFKK